VIKIKTFQLNLMSLNVVLLLALLTKDSNGTLITLLKKIKRKSNYRLGIKKQKFQELTQKQKRYMNKPLMYQLSEYQ